MKFEKVVYQTVEPGTYGATISMIEHRTDGPFGGDGYLLLTFKLSGNKYPGVTLTGAASARYSNKSKFYRWAKAILGAEPPDSLDAETLIGRRVLVEVENEVKDGTTFNKVIALRPWPKKTEPEPEPEPWEEELAEADEIPF